MKYHVIDGQIRVMVRGFDDAHGTIVPVGMLSPEDAVRHAEHLESDDIADLTADAFDAVVRVRAVRARSMPRAGVTWREPADGEA